MLLASISTVTVIKNMNATDATVPNIYVIELATSPTHFIIRPSARGSRRTQVNLYMSITANISTIGIRQIPMIPIKIATPTAFLMSKAQPMTVSAASAKYFPATVTFRPDQFATVRRLQDQRKLSEVCQKAVDEETKR